MNKHSGELVELDRSHSGWELHPVAPGYASAAPPGNQWVCRDGAQPSGAPDTEFGHFGADIRIARRMREEVLSVANAEAEAFDRALSRRMREEALQANWAAQESRVRAP